MKNFQFACLGIFAVILASSSFPAPCGAQSTKSSGEGYTAYSLPAKHPVPLATPTFVAVLLGGHADVDEATRDLCAHSGAGVKFVAEKIRAAHAIFIAGGDQSNYVRFWTGTPVQEEINAAMARGVPIGGISAGLAVQGQFVFTSMIDTITTPEALADPYGPLITLSRDFLNEPGLSGIITDSHFSQRDRMGRSIAFMSRIIQDGWATSIHDIGIDETTAVVLDPSGHAKVLGKGAAYFMTLDHRPEQCAYKKPLTVRGAKILKVQAGPNATFDFNSWTSPSAEAMEANVVEGNMKVTPDAPAK